MLLAVVQVAAAGAVLAQPTSYPRRPIRFIVPLPPGGGADLVARVTAERLSKSLGRQIVID